jgi:hydrogenase/urease accessory protein HupE
VSRALAIVACLAVLFTSRAAFAHALGVSRGEYTVTAEGIDASLLFRQDELAASMTPPEVIAATRIDADGARCEGALDKATPDAPDGLRITAHFACGHRPKHLRLHAGFLERLAGGHAHVASFGHGAEHLLVLASPDVDIDTGAPPSPGFLGFVRAGIEHILTGPDHLLFLLGLVLLRRDDSPRRARIKAIVFVLTAFTVGHSVSLAIATLGGLAPRARIVEPLVALSVAYIGAENLFAKRARMDHRWRVTAPFGLVHGFAFASGLLLVELPRRDLPLALFGFNLGVEVGQLAVMTLVLPLLFLLARRERAYDAVRAVLSAGVLGCGLVWFVTRLL